MAKHSVATLNTEVTGEKGASRLLASLVSHCLYWWWLGWAGVGWGMKGEEEH